MPAYELNIGLDSKDLNEPFRRNMRLQAAVRMLDPDAWQVMGNLDDADEPCLWAKVSLAGGAELVDKCWELCEALGQDCIAVRFEGGNGALLGPKADDWGDFNPAYFRRPDYAEEV